ncbi:TPA: N-6 DNA methylase [Streptococcus pneumoniae]
MITGELKNKIDQLWEILWTEGNANPLTNIEQLTYLLFMKDLDSVELGRESDAEFLGIPYEGVFPKDKPEYRWSTFKNIGDAQEVYRLMTQEIFPFIKNLKGDTDDTAFSRYMREAIFQINKPATLQKAISILDVFPTRGLDVDFDNDKQSITDIGDIYEYLLSKLSTAGKNGQFRTPRHIIDMMVELMQPTIKDIISDPAMGSAGFLVSASRYLKRKKDEWETNTDNINHFHNQMFHGNDTDTTMLRLGAMNMMLHGVENPQISYLDSLSQDNEEADKYTLVLANPPFKGSLDYNSTSNDLLATVKTKKTELLFLSLFLRTLKPGGRAAVIVPDGVLFGSSKAHKGIRQEIVENHKLDAVISMPSGVFKPYAGVSTAILIFTKTGNGGTDKVWFYDMKADGLSLDDKRQPISDNDIPDIIERFHHLEKEAERQRTDQSFFVPVAEIKENDYDLSINKYKEIEYEKVEHYLKTHLDEESISKLYHNKKLTSDDMLALEKLLWEKLGSKADYQSHYENKAIPRLVREIIGLDRESANRIFSKFLSDENLNARQISFVKLIVDYIVENGFLETKVLTQEPFKSYGSVQLLFQHQLPVLRNIVQIIELINNRAGEAA